MKMGKRITMFITLIALIVTGCVVYTYSKYVSSASGTGNASIAKWAVKVNNTDIATTKDFTLNDFTWANTTSNVATGKIAPGSVGKTTLTIDATTAEVDVAYTVSVDNSKLPESLQDQLVVTSVGGQSGSTVSGVINQGDSKTVEVVVSWVDTAANDTKDTTAGSTVESIELPITVTASQNVTAG